MKNASNRGEEADYLTATQVGAVAENIVASQIISASRGRLCPFLPVADDGGVDLLIFDKKTRNAVPVQVKSRTRTLKRSPKCVHFGIRKKTFNDTPGTVVIAMLFDWKGQAPRCMWLLPGDVVAEKAAGRGRIHVLRPSVSPTSRDKWRPYRCEGFNVLVERLIELLERRPRTSG
ncbi:MAG: hypothetical protein KAX44_06760 [Candidatus Brocadiae bacterium]|nr:hypothetical protein [Candidatus Brocadiia bacterium]